MHRFILLILLLMLLLPVIFIDRFISSPQNRAVFQSRAASGNTITVVGTEAPAIQQAIDAAHDGDTIIIPQGTYSGPTATPIGLGNAIWVSADRGASDTCFIRIDGKSLTLKGEGGGWTRTTLFGEGHDKPYQDPYQRRGGVCILNNARVTLDNIRVKEFQKRCVVVYNSTIIVKNSIIDGCDEGGVSMLGNSGGLFVNNYFAEMNFGGVMLWQNSQAKIINNIFYNAAVLFFYHPGTNDQARADIVNNIFSGIKSNIAQVDWWQAEPSQIKMNNLSYNVIWRSKDQICNPKVEFWCDSFPGKITADPLYNTPVTDPRGIAAWSDFSLKDGSPALGVGDPTIPGPKNLGVAGGPCVDPNAAICATFIGANVPGPIQPTPTQAPEIFPTETLTTPPIIISPIIPTVIQTKLTPIILQKNVFPQGGVSLTIQNKYSNKIIKIKGLFLQNSYSSVNKDLLASGSMKLSYTDFCQNIISVNGGIFYFSPEDNFQIVRFKNISLDCSKDSLIEIQ